MNILKGVSILVVVTLLCCCIYNNDKETSTGFRSENISKVEDKKYNIPKGVETRNTTNNLENNSNGKIYIMYPRIVNYTILEYGKYSDRENLDHYIYLDIPGNRTIIFIYGGKKSFDYDLSVDKIVEYSRGNITVYIKERYGRDPIITSPYLVIEIKGIVNNTNIEYIN